MSSPIAYSKVDPPGPLDLTSVLKLAHIAATGSLSVVYKCVYAEKMEVAVKAITFPPGFDPKEREDFTRKVKRELGMWAKLMHPNIVPLLGTAHGHAFGSDYPCIVSTWMTHGTLFEHMKQGGIQLSVLDRIQLIKGSVSGLEYLHSEGIIHGNLHPGNILIDDAHNARLADFGFSLTLFPIQDQTSYLWTDSIRPSRPMWAAPELLYPELYPKLKFLATFQSDIYSLGSIILFVLSGKCPWQDRGEAENKLKEYKNPPRPVWPVNMPDGVWDFIERCWSPRDPENRPSIKKVLSFSTDSLEQLLRPNPASEINVVLFGALGSGKSSVINLLAEKEIAQISSGVEPCTERPRSYQISINGKDFRLWDTTGFFLADGGPTSHLLPYEHAHTVLRNLPDGVNLIIICAPKGVITHSLRRLYWLINDFFYGGRAPIAFVITHFDTSDEEWWERNERDIAERTNIPTQSIPHVCITTNQDGGDQSKHALKELLRTYATAVAPIPLRRDFSSYTTASSDLITHCRLRKPEATFLMDKFRRPLRPFNVVLLGEAESPIINLIAGPSVAGTSTGAVTYTRSYKINTGLQQFRIWDPMGVNNVQIDHNLCMGGLENACRLIRDLSDEGGVDLLMFCKRYGKPTAEELNGYRLIEETLCKGQSPVAIVITHVESPYKWWETNGSHLVKCLGGDVVGHSCIPPLASYDSHDVELDKTRTESRLSIEAMLEDCVCSPNTWLSMARVHVIFAKITPKVLTRKWGAKMSVRNLMGRYGFTREKAERFIQLYNGQ